MIRARTIAELEAALLSYRKDSADTQKEKRIGLVPTMGALHEGHLSLLRRATAECDYVACCIFINPAQFNDPKDFESYPVVPEEDMRLLENEKVDLCFMPDAAEIFPEGDSPLHFSLGDFEKTLCAPRRPGHFSGVMLIVARWLNLFRPEAAYFGKKDYQQYVILKQMAHELFFSTEIIGCDTVREEDGLAMSSRNQLLDKGALEQANLIYRALSLGRKTFEARDCETDELCEIVADVIETGSRNKVEYTEIVDPESLQPVVDLTNVRRILIAVAVYCGEVRLIDNVECFR